MHLNRRCLYHDFPPPHENNKRWILTPLCVVYMCVYASREYSASARRCYIVSFSCQCIAEPTIKRQPRLGRNSFRFSAWRHTERYISVSTTLVRLWWGVAQSSRFHTIQYTILSSLYYSITIFRGNEMKPESKTDLLSKHYTHLLKCWLLLQLAFELTPFMSNLTKKIICLSKL